MVGCRPVFLAVLSTWLLQHGEATDRPIVGILAQEIPHGWVDPGKSSYIPAAYVKAVEASGARVAPIFINRTQEYYKRIMSSVNGLVLPGGEVNFTTPKGYAAAGRIIIDLIQKLQDAGVHFPVLGVCQGFELLMFLAANTSSPDDIFVSCDADNIALPLAFRQKVQESQLYKYASSEVMEILSNLPVTSNHHRECVTEERLKARHLNKTWRILSTNKDIHGLEFISSSEHFQRPIAGVQFHPEKNLYEWKPTQANPHSRKAIISARIFYDWLVNESRANDQHFATSKEEDNSLVYNYSPQYTGGRGGYDEQLYFF